MAAKFDFIIDKKAKLSKEIELIDSVGNPISLIGWMVKCVIKESYNTSTVLYTLTELNGGIVVLDDALGKIALFISAEDTDIEANFGVYDIIRIDEAAPLLDNERILEGRIMFSKGVT